MKPLITHLLGETRTAILAELLLHPEEKRHVRDLARMTGISPGTLHRELTALNALGILRRNEVGRQVFFSADPECSVFEDLAGLLRKTAGMVDVVRDALLPHVKAIRAAFIYGSVASGSETSHSDVDVMVVGDIDFGVAVAALSGAQAALRRDVNPTVMTLQEFLKKHEDRNGFVSAVWKRPKLWLLGSKNELG